MFKHLYANCSNIGILVIFQSFHLHQKDEVLPLGVAKNSEKSYRVKKIFATFYFNVKEDRSGNIH